MFKVGDTVKRIGRYSSTLGMYFAGYPFKIIEVNDDYVIDPSGSHHSPIYLQLVEPAPTHLPLYSTEDAVKWLEERGYAVTPPPEPLKGEVIIYRNNLGEVWSTTKDHWNKWNASLRETVTILAIVPWTEGDGIN